MVGNIDSAFGFATWHLERSWGEVTGLNALWNWGSVLFLHQEDKGHCIGKYRLPVGKYLTGELVHVWQLVCVLRSLLALRNLPRLLLASSEHEDCSHSRGERRNDYPAFDWPSSQLRDSFREPLNRWQPQVIWDSVQMEMRVKGSLEGFSGHLGHCCNTSGSSTKVAKQ